MSLAPSELPSSSLLSSDISIHSVTLIISLFIMIPLFSLPQMTHTVPFRPFQTLLSSQSRPMRILRFLLLFFVSFLTFVIGYHATGRPRKSPSLLPLISSLLSLFSLSTGTISRVCCLCIWSGYSCVIPSLPLSISLSFSSSQAAKLDGTHGAILTFAKFICNRFGHEPYTVCDGIIDQFGVSLF